MGLALDFRIMSSDSGPSGHSSCMVFGGSEGGFTCFNIFWGGGNV